MINVELFAGGGGSAVGMQKAGFRPILFYEIDSAACQTLTKNILSKTPTLEGKVIEHSVESVRWGFLANKVQVLSAGVPCQPFSLAGKHLAESDNRNLFPEVLRAARVLSPQAILIENVCGLLRESNQPYFEYIIIQLEYPSIRPRRGESWQSHKKRLLQHKQHSKIGREYNVVYALINAADFGVPQQRKRVFMFAIRSNFAAFKFPRATHCREVLLTAKLLTNDFHKIGIGSRKHSNQPRIPFASDLKPWVTVRDALKGLPDPAESEESAILNHWKLPGARVYPCHSGSIMDLPAKTIKAGVHGTPGGENTILDDKGNFRYFTLRELARLQTFPDNHLFFGNKTQITRQIGNAVPCRLATIFFKSIKKCLEDE